MPRHFVFLFDALGALLSALLLGLVLPAMQEHIGMPVSILYFLAGIACVFLLYSSVCYFFAREKWLPFLKTVILANSIYILISVGLIFYHFQQLTGLGITYFVLEIIVLFGVVAFEARVYRKGEQGKA
jgi:hypothetical protein